MKDNNIKEKMMCIDDQFKIFQIYSCPVMYLNKVSNDETRKRRPVVLLNILKDGEKSYGLILGSSSENNRLSERYILPWKLKTKTNIITSYFDFSRFIRTVDLTVLVPFYDYNHKVVNLDSQLVKLLKIKLNDLFSPRFKFTKNDPINDINWHFYEPYQLLNEDQELINFNEKFIEVPDYILIMNRFFVHSPNTLVIPIYLKKLTKNIIEINLKNNLKIKNIVYADLRAITIISISLNSLLRNKIFGLSIQEVDFFKDQLKMKINLNKNLYLQTSTEKTKTNQLSTIKTKSTNKAWAALPQSADKSVDKDDEWPELGTKLQREKLSKPISENLDSLPSTSKLDFEEWPELKKQPKK